MPNHIQDFPAYATKRDLLDHLVTLVKVCRPDSLLEVVQRIGNTDLSELPDPAFEHPETNG